MITLDTRIGLIITIKFDDSSFTQLLATLVVFEFQL